MAARVVSKATILCVEEDSNSLYFRQLILEQHHYKVLTATSAQRALDIFLSEEVQLVITAQLVGRDAGESMAAEMKRLRPGVPVLLLTTGTGAISPLADDRLEKPETPAQLLTHVERLLAKRPKVCRQSLRPNSKHPVPIMAAENETHTLKNLLAEIVESSQDAILSKTLDGKITSWNRAAERMYGYSAEEIVGRNVTLLVPPDRPNEVHEILMRLQQGEHLQHYETIRKRKDGGIVHVSLSISPIRDSRGDIVGASTISRDISNLKLAERALRESEKLAVAGRMAVTVAHEINNPLEALSNIFYLLKQDPKIEGASREFVITGEEELKRITQITRLTLGFHRDRQTTPTIVSIPDLIENVLALYQRKIEALGVKVDKSYDSIGTVRGNSGELRQVFSNLVVNAIDALASRGDRLFIRARLTHNPKGVAGVRVAIADNGPGISQESLSHLFEPFFTTKGDKGTGIGLWVSNGIVKKHGGIIQVKSRANRAHSGTVFSIFIPRDIADAKAEENKEIQLPPLRRAS